MKNLNFILVIALLGIVGCSKNKTDEKQAENTTATQKPVDANAKAVEYTKDREYTEESLSYRNKSLYSNNGDTEEIPDIDYHKEAPMTSKRFERAYDNAPPMIPHDTEGMLPIIKGNNACLGCHLPNVAKSMGATPIPQTHFTNFRPTTVYKNGELIKEGKTVSSDGDIGNTGDIVIAKQKKLDHIYQGRFNCSQCHAPQADTAPLIENTFQGGFRDESGKHGSNLLDNINEGIEAD